MSGVDDKKKDSLGETVKTVVIAILIALVVRTFLYEPFNIPSGSMKPTLLVGDYLFVSKFSYGYSKYSFPFDMVPFKGRILGSDPERGDVVVFRKPTDTSIDYIKRIIGLPGDRIQVIRGILHVNGKPVGRKRVEDFPLNPKLANSRTVRQYDETLPNGVTHRILEVWDDNGPLDNTPVYTVPEGHYFAMGDNRDQSQDSRVLNEVGFIPAQNLIGRAEFLFFSIDTTGMSWWQVWKWPQAIRFGRILNGIH